MGRDRALDRHREEGWEVAHTTDELEVRPVDVVIGHHYTSTFPGSHFVDELMVTVHQEGRHVAVTGRTVTVRRPGKPTEHRELDKGELADWLGVLAVPLTDDERARLLSAGPR